jgi:hypothetical protein
MTSPNPAGGLAAPATLNRPTSQFISPMQLGQDLLIRQEVALGVIREIVPPITHMGLVLVPFLDVPTDDVIFDYARGLSDGLAPARAEDAEAELAQKDDVTFGEGRASVIDWSVKDRYNASDVHRYREYLAIAEQLRDTGTFQLTVTSAISDFMARMARDTLLRKRKLDNRIEWMIMGSLSTGTMVYNDGKIKFTVDYGRPANQDSQAPRSGSYAGTTHDPIGDIVAVQEYMYDLRGVRITQAICSRRFLNKLMLSDKFGARTGLPGGLAAGVDPNYLLNGWGPQAAVDIVAAATGLTFIEYDSVYRTRAVGSNNFVNNRFTPINKVIFLPDPADIAEIDETQIGFGKVLTSPHPMGNWQSGFYAWERETVDPWSHDIGSGIKAFPVLPFMEYTYTWNVTLP